MLSKRFLSTIKNLSDFVIITSKTEYNMNLVKKIEYTYNNPQFNKSSYFYTPIYECRIILSKNDMFVQKDIYGDDHKKVVEAVQTFLDNEIKL